MVLSYPIVLKLRILHCVAEVSEVFVSILNSAGFTRECSTEFLMLIDTRKNRIEIRLSDHS